MKTFTYGILPTKEEYDAAWDKLIAEEELHGGLFHFGNDERLGTCALSQEELWDEILLAYEEWDKDGWIDDQIGNWLSAIMFSLGFEWI